MYHFNVAAINGGALYAASCLISDTASYFNLLVTFCIHNLNLLVNQ